MFIYNWLIFSIVVGVHRFFSPPPPLFLSLSLCLFRNSLQHYASDWIEYICIQYNDITYNLYFSCLFVFIRMKLTWILSITISIQLYKCTCFVLIIDFSILYTLLSMLIYIYWSFFVKISWWRFLWFSSHHPLLVLFYTVLLFFSNPITRLQHFILPLHLKFVCLFFLTVYCVMQIYVNI